MRPKGANARAAGRPGSRGGGQESLAPFTQSTDTFPSQQDCRKRVCLAHAVPFLSPPVFPLPPPTYVQYLYFVPLMGESSLWLFVLLEDRSP